MSFKNPSKVLPQVLGAVCASLGFLILGTVRAWSSPALPSLFDSGTISGLNRTIDEPWIASTPQICSIFGAWIAPWPLKFFGRKWTMVSLAIPWTLGFLLIGLAQNKAMIYAGRVCAGLMEGMIAPCAQVYIAECSSPRIRGVLGSASAIGLSMGTLFTFVIGAYASWDVLTLALITFPLLFATSMSCLPESPVWLLTRNQELKARKALQFYRGQETDIEEEFKRVRDNIEKTRHLQSTFQPSDFFQAPVLKPLGISMALMFFQQFSGVNAVFFYTVKIFRMAGSTVDPHLASIVVAIVLFFSLLVAAYMSDVCGRRILLMISGSLMALSQMAMGIFFYLKELWGDKVAEETIGSLPLASLVVFVIGFSSGFGGVPFLIMGELFPIRFRHVLSPVSASFFALCTFTIVRTFPDLAAALNLYGAFWFYASWSAVAVVFVYFLLPETKGKTLEEIEQLFKNDGGKLPRNESNDTHRHSCPREVTPVKSAHVALGFTDLNRDHATKLVQKV